jgi:hypothetical protein
LRQRLKIKNRKEKKKRRRTRCDMRRTGCRCVSGKKRRWNEEEEDGKQELEEG